MSPPSSGFDECRRSGYSGRSPDWLYHDYPYRFSDTEVKPDTVQTEDSANRYDQCLRQAASAGRMTYQLRDAAGYLRQTDEYEVDPGRQCGIYCNILLKIAHPKPVRGKLVYSYPGRHRHRYAIVTAWIGSTRPHTPHHYRTKAARPPFHTLPDFDATAHVELRANIAAGVEVDGIRRHYQLVLSSGVFKPRSPGDTCARPSSIDRAQTRAGAAEPKDERPATTPLWAKANNLPPLIAYRLLDIEYAEITDPALALTTNEVSVTCSTLRP